MPQNNKTASQKLKYGFFFCLWAITFFLVSYLWIGTTIKYTVLENIVLTMLLIITWAMGLKFAFKLGKLNKCEQ